MGGTIVVNHGTITSMATALRSVGDEFTLGALLHTDVVSTILANSNAQNSFNDAQQGNKDLADALNASATQLIEIRQCLGEVDIAGGNIFNQVPQ